MKCENDKEQITLWLNNEMSEQERTAFEQHLAGCAECREELKTAQHLVTLLNSVPAPQASEDLSVRFQAMLEEYKESQKEKINPLSSLVEKIRTLFSFQPGMQLAYSIVLVLVGTGLGLLFSRQNISSKQVDNLSAQVSQMKEMMTLALLENPSASERIKGVSYTSEIKSANQEVIDALLTTLNNDQNVNVRLVTLEALTKYANEPSVREGLIKAIVNQDSPLMQSALADVMLKLQEKKSVQPFRKLLQQKDLDTTIRGKIEQTISKLI